VARIVLGANQYGKSEVRLVKVSRDGERHEIQDLNVSSQLRGDLEATHTRGDNGHVVPTDTQKNTVYAFARQHRFDSIEELALLLGGHFTGEFAWITGGRWEIEQYAWDRIPVDGREHEHSFARTGTEKRTTVVTLDGEDGWVVSGLTGLVVLKSTGSEFRGYPKDRFTTLPETTDRVLATSVTARWRYSSTDLDFNAVFASVRQVLLAAFARTHSLSLQQTLYRMGAEVLEVHPQIAEIRLSMPNRHHVLVDLSPFGLDNPNEVFSVTDRPYGLIEGVVERDDAPPAGRAWESTPGFC
jgi:urate oxidase